MPGQKELAFITGLLGGYQQGRAGIKDEKQKATELEFRQQREIEAEKIAKRNADNQKEYLKLAQTAEERAAKEDDRRARADLSNRALAVMTTMNDSLVKNKELRQSDALFGLQKKKYLYDMEREKAKEERFNRIFGGGSVTTPTGTDNGGLPAINVPGEGGGGLGAPGSGMLSDLQVRGMSVDPINGEANISFGLPEAPSQTDIDKQNDRAQKEYDKVAIDKITNFYNKINGSVIDRNHLDDPAIPVKYFTEQIAESDIELSPAVAAVAQKYAMQLKEEAQAQSKSAVYWRDKWEKDKAAWVKSKMEIDGEAVPDTKKYWEQWKKKNEEGKKYFKTAEENPDTGDNAYSDILSHPAILNRK